MPFVRACFGALDTEPHLTPGVRTTPTQAQAPSHALYSQRIMFVTLLLPMCATGSSKTETVTKALERQAGACVLFLVPLLFDFCRSHRPLLCGLEVICVSATPHTRPPLCQTPGPAPLRLCFFYYLCVRFAIFPCFLVPTRRTKDSGQVAGPPAQIE